jgi:drug/metabolite transporter (DMT)-like permease
METQHAVGWQAGGRSRNRWVRRAVVASWRANRWPASVRGLAWSMASGLLFVVLNTVMRGLAMQLDPYQTQFLRYVAAIVAMAPLMLRSGLASYRPQNVVGQFIRGGVHTAGLCLWFVALPAISLADTTAIGFTTPIFIMVGAALVLHEPMRWERCLAAAIGFAGVLLVVGPQLTGGSYHALVMLASSPVFAASYLITKALTRYERASVIVVWQAISVSTFSLPLALLHWQWPTAGQWLLVLLCGVLGSAGHYCLTRSFSAADISATQSVKFLDLVWAAILGWLVFGAWPSQSSLLGGAVICASTLWIARREARGRPVPRSA